MGSFKHLVVPIELRESQDPENPGNALQIGAGQWIASPARGAPVSARRHGDGRGC